jgi:hypothetical protein
VIVLLSAPAWILLAFLPKDRRQDILNYLGRILACIMALAGTNGNPASNQPDSAELLELPECGPAEVSGTPARAIEMLSDVDLSSAQSFGYQSIGK